MQIINFHFSSSHLPALCECSIGDKESDVFRKRVTEDILAVISYLLTLLLLKQRQDWRWGITEPLSTGVASLITVLSLALGGGAPLSVFRAVSVGFDAVLTCWSLEGDWRKKSQSSLQFMSLWHVLNTCWCLSERHWCWIVNFWGWGELFSIPSSRPSATPQSVKERGQETNSHEFHYHFMRQKCLRERDYFNEKYRNCCRHVIFY